MLRIANNFPPIKYVIKSSQDRPASPSRHAAAGDARMFGPAGGKSPDAQRGSGRGAQLLDCGGGNRVSGCVQRAAWRPPSCNGRAIRPTLCGNLSACPVAVPLGTRECEDSFTSQSRAWPGCRDRIFPGFMLSHRIIAGRRGRNWAAQRRAAGRPSQCAPARSVARDPVWTRRYSIFSPLDCATLIASIIGAV